MQLMHKLFFSNAKPFYQTLIPFNIKLYNILKPDKIFFIQFLLKIFNYFRV